MYQSIYYNRKTSTIFLWDDKLGATSFKYQPYAYRKSSTGKYLSIFGDKLEKTTKFYRGEPGLFSSDIPVETKILIDAYGESDDVSTGHRMVVLDIEVDSKGGYPNVDNPKQKITAIALYDAATKKYFCYVLDEDKLVVSRVEGDKVIEAFETEEDLLMAFLNKWEEISPTIATGWNCIPVDGIVYGKNSLTKIKSLIKGDKLSDSDVECVYPTSKKRKIEMLLSNGHIITSSEDHKFPILSIPKDRYTTLDIARSYKNDIVDRTMEVKEIDLSKSNFVKIPIHKNPNEGLPISDDEIYLAGFIYTYGSIFDKKNKSNGYRVYQSNTKILESFTQVTTKIGGNSVHGYRRRIKYSVMRNMHSFIYDENGNKKFDIEKLSRLSTRQFYIFLSGILDGDGCASNGISSCDYTETGTEDLYSLCFWNGMFVTKRKNTIRYINYDHTLFRFRHPVRWSNADFGKETPRNSKQKASQILYKKLDGHWYVRIDGINETEDFCDMVDIKTSTGYFIYDGVRTHNCDGFDFPYLHGRLVHVFDEHAAGRLSPIGIAYYNQYKQKMTIAGVNCLDYLYLYKQYAGKNLPNYRLDTVGMEELKVGKVEYEGSLDDLKKSDINKFIEYNLHDVVLIVQMNAKLQFIELAQTICHVCHTGYEEFNISGKILEGALLTYLRRKHLVAPNKPLQSEEELAFGRGDDDDEDNDKVGFEGAYVKDPIPGRYDWVCSADINSLYPSTIMSLNISPETKICVIPEWSSEKLVKKSQDKIEFGGEEYTYEEFGKEIVANNLSVSANGVVYDQGKLGCIPDILKKWFSERVEYKKKMVAASDEGDKAGEVFWKRRQHVQKILLNSLYGVLGLPGWRWYDLDNALSVTATGQEIIKTSAKLVNTWFNKRCGTTDKDYVIYIDTDSVVGSSKIKMADGSEKLLSDIFNESVQNTANFNVIDITGRNFVFPKNLDLPYYDEKNNVVKFGKTKYIEKHRVKKKLYKLITESGKSVTVTGDHSVMIFGDDKKVKKMLAKDVETGMSVIVI